VKKIVVLFLLVLAGSLGAIAQKLSYSAVKNRDLIYVLNNIEKTTSYANDRDLHIRVYNVADPTGSAHVQGDDEITNSLYIAVSEYDESPEQHVYRLSSVYNPKFVNWVKSAAGAKLVINYGPDNKRRTATITISLRKLVIN